MKNSRSEKSHVSTANDRVRDARVEGRDGNKHDGVGKSGKDVLGNDNQHVPRGDTLGREHDNSKLRENGSHQTTHEAPAPETHGRELLRPLSCIVSQTDLEGEVDQNSEGHVLGTESLVKKLEVGDSIVGLEADLGNKVDDDDGLDVLQVEHTPHDLVDVPDAILVFGTLLALHQTQADRHSNVSPAPKGKVSTQRHQAVVKRFGAEPTVGKLFGVESQKDSIRQELASSQADRLRGGSVRDVAGRQKCQGPAVNSNVLSSAHEHEEEPPPGEAPDGRTAFLAHGIHQSFDPRAQVKHANSR